MGIIFTTNEVEHVKCDYILSYINRSLYKEIKIKKKMFFVRKCNTDTLKVESYTNLVSTV